MQKTTQKRPKNDTDIYRYTDICKKRPKNDANWKFYKLVKLTQNDQQH